MTTDEGSVAVSISSQLEIVSNLIATRRTSLRIDGERPVPAELVAHLLRLATWAPNHKRTFPWRFGVLTGDGRRRLGVAVAAFERRCGSEPARLESVKAKYLRSPVVILVGAPYERDPVRRTENRDAVAAGIQNLLLGATAAGLASHWATGGWMSDPDIKALVQLAAVDELIALVYLGWPVGEVSVVARPEPTVVFVDH